MQYGQCPGRLETGDRCERSAGHRPPCRPTRAQRWTARLAERGVVPRNRELNVTTGHHVSARDLGTEPDFGAGRARSWAE